MATENLLEQEIQKRNLEFYEKRNTNSWQRKLLPWFIILPTVLIAVFIGLATTQMSRFNNAISTKPDSTFIGKVIPAPIDAHALGYKSMDYIRWVTLTRMEQESFYRRYSQAGFLLMTRIYTKYLGFFTGMILAIVGAVFIIGKLQEPSTAITAEFEKAKGSLTSSSPGIIFAVLGTILMLSTILRHDDITVQDQALYLTPAAVFQLNQTQTDTLSGVEIDDAFDESPSPEKNKANK